MSIWGVGERVEQPTYGPGTVIESSEIHTIVEFDSGDRKVFATRILVLKALKPPVVAPVVVAIKKPPARKVAKKRR